MRSPLRILFAFGALLAALAHPSIANADPSAWVFTGGGALGWKEGGINPNTSALLRTNPNAALQSLGYLPTGRNFGVNGAMTIDVGVGTTPDARFILGGLFRIQPLFGAGVDLAVLGRAATRGFQAGSFGVALDAGGYARFWGIQSVGFMGDVAIGFPLGFQLTLQTMVGTDGAVAVGAVAGIDLLRLTIYRQVLLDKWPNPSPAWQKKSAFTRRGLEF